MIVVRNMGGQFFMSPDTETPAAEPCSKSCSAPVAE